MNTAAAQNLQTTAREGRYTGPSLQADALPKRAAMTHAESCQTGRDKVMAKWAAEKPAKVKQTRAQIATAKDAQAIADLQAAGGIVAYSAWSVGSGRYVKARAVPAGAAVFPNRERTPDHVRAWFAAHPRALRCVAIIA